MNKRSVPVLAALFIVSALGTFFSLRLRPEPPLPAVPHPTARRVAQATQHLELLLQPPPPSSSTSSPQPVGPRTLRVSEDDLNVTLAGNAAARRQLRAYGISAVQVLLTPPSNLSLRVAMKVQGQPRRVRIDGTLSPDAAQGLRYTVTRAQVGQFLLPPALATTQAQKLVHSFLRRAHQHLPLTVQTVQVADKTLIITGLPTPPATPPAASPARH